MDRKQFLKGVAAAIAGVALQSWTTAATMARKKAEKSEWKAFLIAGIDADGRMHSRYTDSAVLPLIKQDTERNQQHIDYMRAEMDKFLSARPL